MRTFEKIPAILQPGEGREAWEARRLAMVNTVAQIEYGCRPEMAYTVTWNLCSREEMPEINGERLITDITVTTELGSYTFPLYTFLPKRAEKVPETLLICSQSRVLGPQKLPEGFKMEDIPKLLAKLKPLIKKISASRYFIILSRLVNFKIKFIPLQRATKGLLL